MPDKTGKRLSRLISDLRLVVESQLHTIAWTHAGEVNRTLFDFMRKLSRRVFPVTRRRLAHDRPDERREIAHQARAGQLLPK